MTAPRKYKLTKSGKRKRYDTRSYKGGKATAKKKSAVAVERARYMGIRVPKRLSAKWKRKINAKFRGRAGLKHKLLPAKRGINMGLLVDQKRYRQMFIGTCIGLDVSKSVSVEHFGEVNNDTFDFSRGVEELRAGGDREKALMDTLDYVEERKYMYIDFYPKDLNVDVYGEPIDTYFIYPVTGFYVSATTIDGVSDSIMLYLKKKNTHSTILLIQVRVRYYKR